MKKEFLSVAIKSVGVSALGLVFIFAAESTGARVAGAAGLVLGITTGAYALRGLARLNTLEHTFKRLEDSYRDRFKSNNPRNNLP